MISGREGGTSFRQLQGRVVMRIVRWFEGNEIARVEKKITHSR